MFEKMTKRQVRYLCYRLRTGAEKEEEVNDIPEGFKEYFEEQDYFDSWINFAMTWDIDDKLKAELRTYDEQTEWNSVMKRESVEMPIKKKKKNKKKE